MASQKGITETWWDNSHDWGNMVDGSRLLRKERWGRRRRGGVKVILCAKENLKCLEVNCINCKTPIKSLWVKIREGSYSGHLLPNQNDAPKKVIIGSLKQVLCQQNLVFMATSTTQKNHMSPTKLECAECCFLIHITYANKEWVATGLPTPKLRELASYYPDSWWPWLHWLQYFGVWNPAEHAEGENQDKDYGFWKSKHQLAQSSAERGSVGIFHRL